MIAVQNYNTNLDRMRCNREAEFAIYWHSGEWPEPDLDAAQKGIVCADGVVAVEMVPERVSYGSLLVPESAQGRTRAHFGTVVSSAVPWLAAGARVCVKAYKGLHFQPLVCEGGADVPDLLNGYRLHPDFVALMPDYRPDIEQGDLKLERFLQSHTHTGIVYAAGANTGFARGDRAIFSKYHHALGAGGLDYEKYERLDTVGGLIVQHKRMLYGRLSSSDYCGNYVRLLGGATPITECIVMVEREGAWRPAPGWVWIERDLKREDKGVHRTEFGSRPYRKYAKIVRHWRDEELDGKRCLVDPEPNAGIWFGLGAADQTNQLMRERDVHAVIDD